MRGWTGWMSMRREGRGVKRRRKGEWKKGWTKMRVGEKCVEGRKKGEIGMNGRGE